MRSIEQLTEEILSLPSESRALLADKLVESLEFDTDSAIQSIWVTEAKLGSGVWSEPALRDGAAVGAQQTTSQTQGAPPPEREAVSRGDRDI